MRGALANIAAAAALSLIPISGCGSHGGLYSRIDGGGDIPQRGRKTLYTRWKGVGGRYMPHQGQRELARAARRAAAGGAR
jgi:hypothetical protein